MMELREPKRKRRVRASLQHPFPILNKDVIAIPTNKALWQVYTGKYSGDFVVVDAPDEMMALHSNGFFGKGSLSRGSPEFGKVIQGVPPFIRQRQWYRRCKWFEQHQALLKNYEEQTIGMVDGIQQHSDVEKQISCENEDNQNLCNENNGNKVQSETVEKIKESGSGNTEKKDDGVDDEVITLVEKQTVEKIKESGSGNTEKKHDGVDDEVITLVEKQSVKIIKESGSGNTEKKHDSVDDEVITLDSAEEDEVSTTVRQQVPLENKIVQNKVNDCESETKTGDKRKQSVDSESPSSNLKLTKHVSENDISIEKKSEEHTQFCVDMVPEKMVLVLSDSDSDDEEYLTNICPRLEKEKFPVYENLHLTLEEAFFLSFGLGCLQVIDLFGNCLSLNGLWELFCKSQKDFIQKYVAYHYFRSKGWVVKPGIKFGGDFLLYKQGPTFYHASYIVLVEVIESSTLNRLPGLRKTLSWTRVLGLNRLAETATKEILLCQIIWPSDASPESMAFPSILSKFQVSEVLLRRWKSSEEREENDPL